ncbi:hypothetical protein K0M31_013624 [Melipona bicolor]|uniref:Uncharacterized protein n=1 Tax=Melipona bicolor TaxID=60889 RepID=A0AA40FHS9_9HYME|nr:hypothetical protein K0M31_013624 [Melipona bicolor]
MEPIEQRLKIAYRVTGTCFVKSTKFAKNGHIRGLAKLKNTEDRKNRSSEHFGLFPWSRSQKTRSCSRVRGGVHEADTCVSPWLSIPSKDLEEDYTGKEEEEEETRGHREHNKVEQEAEDEEVMKEEDARREFAEFWLGEHTSGHYRSLST